jgi:tetratricopeptide (TPR) repeat protein
VLEKGGPVLPPDLPKKTIEELQALAREVSGGGREAGKAVRIYEELLKRDLPEDVRREASFQLGYGYRALKDHAKEEAVFRELLRKTDPATPDGANAVFQVAWSRFYQNDYQESGALMEKLSEMPSAEPWFQAHALYRVGQFAHMAKDDGRARAFLERLLREHTAEVPATQAFILDDAKRILKEIDGR